MRLQTLPKRATVTFLVALVLALLPSAGPARGQEDPRTRQGQVKEQQAAVGGQIDVLEANAADVNAALAAVQAQTAAAEATLAAAQKEVDAAAAVVASAAAAESDAAAKVEERTAQLRAVAIDSYVNADQRTIQLEVAFEDPREDAEHHALRESLAQFHAENDKLLLDRLHTAQAELATARQSAEAAQASAAAKKADVQAKAEAARTARNAQAAIANDVEKRLDDKLAEAAALRSLDKKLADQISAQELALAKSVRAKQGGGTATAAAKKPPPPGDFHEPPPPAPAKVDLATTHGITVASSIVGRLGAMLDAADAAGLHFTGSGYRSYDSQVALRKQNCGTEVYDVYYRPPSECSPPTARPGTSNHERGLAVDLALDGLVLISHDDPGWIWLNAHAGTYGFANLPSEPWHWSVDGG